MTAKEFLPRIAIIIIFISGAIFAYIESVYLRDHATALGEKGSTVATWMWIYRIVALAMLFTASYIIGGFWRR
jgi:hypothetical protein